MGKITLLQKSAIQAILKLKNLTLKKLTAYALGRIVKSFSDLSHSDAVKVIRHGINIQKRGGENSGNNKSSKKT